MIKPFAEQPNTKRSNPPSEDFAETRQQLIHARAEIVRLRAIIDDILDDTGGEPHVT